MSIERRKLLRSAGANLVLTEGAKGMKGAIQKAEEIVASNPEKFCCCSSSATRLTRKFTKTTGPEIWKIPMARLTFLISGVGTGGSADRRDPLY